MGEFAKWAEQEEQLDQMEGAPRPKVKNWRERATEQVGRFKQHMPLAAEEGAANASEALKQLSALLYGMGYKFRMKRHQEKPDEAVNLLPKDEPGIPGRDISISLPEPDPEPEAALPISLPKSASWMEPRLFSKEAVGPLRAMLQDAKVEASAEMKERRRKSFAPTENPLTSPGFVPMAAIAAPESFRKGFVQADTDASATRNDILRQELEQAKQEFEQALNEEYRGHKAASAGEWLDGLTKGLFSLEKQADTDQGDAMKWLNTYLGAAALLGYGTHRAAEHYVSKRDPARQKHKLYRMALRQRMHDKGVPVLVDFNELPAAHAEAGLVDNLPVQEAKEAFVKRLHLPAFRKGGAYTIPIVKGKAKPGVLKMFRDLLRRYKPLAQAKRKLAVGKGARWRPSAQGLSNIATPEQMTEINALPTLDRIKLVGQVLGR